MELIEKLVVLVHRHRTHLIRFHGLFAPHAASRDQVVLKTQHSTDPFYLPARESRDLFSFRIPFRYVFSAGVGRGSAPLCYLLVSQSAVPVLKGIHPALTCPAPMMTPYTLDKPGEAQEGFELDKRNFVTNHVESSAF